MFVVLVSIFSVRKTRVSYFQKINNSGTLRNQSKCFTKKNLFPHQTLRSHEHGEIQFSLFCSFNQLREEFSPRKKRKSRNLFLNANKKFFPLFPIAVLISHREISVFLFSIIRNVYDHMFLMSALYPTRCNLNSESSILFFSLTIGDH